MLPVEDGGRGAGLLRAPRRGLDAGLLPRAADDLRPHLRRPCGGRPRGGGRGAGPARAAVLHPGQGRVRPRRLGGGGVRHPRGRPHARAHHVRPLPGDDPRDLHGPRRAPLPHPRPRREPGGRPGAADGPLPHEPGLAPAGPGHPPGPALPADHGVVGGPRGGARGLHHGRGTPPAKARDDAYVHRPRADRRRPGPRGPGERPARPGPLLALSGLRRSPCSPSGSTSTGGPT